MAYKPKKAKFLDASQVEQTIVEIEIIAHEEHVSTALAGGAAMQVYGSDRLTTDVDVIASDVLPLQQPKSLTFGGISGLAPNGIPVDVIVRDDEYSALYEAALLYSQPVEGMGMRVVRPEYLAAMKLVADRVKDRGDLEFLILSGELDVAAALKIVREYAGNYAADQLESVVYELEWRLAREKK